MMKHLMGWMVAFGIAMTCFGQGQDIFSLVQSGQIEKVREALKSDPKLVNASGRSGLTPLFVAVSTGNLDMVRLLVDRGADVHAQCNSLTTPLYFAVLNDNRDLYDYLLQAGAEVDVPDFLGRRPLSIAVRDGNAALAESLIENGADPFRTDLRTGQSLLHLAAIEGHADILETLIRHTVKADLSALRTADNPGDRFMVRTEEVR
jgi:ankyrin repeat protein